MDRFGIVLSPHATKDLDRFGEAVFRKIARAISALGENPFPRGKLIKKIKGKNADFYRLRVDKYRVFYVIESGRVVILRVLSKKDAGRFIGRLN